MAVPSGDSVGQRESHQSATLFVTGSDCVVSCFRLGFESEGSATQGRCACPHGPVGSPKTTTRTFPNLCPPTAHSSHLFKPDVGMTPIHH